MNICNPNFYYYEFRSVWKQIENTKLVKKLCNSNEDDTDKIIEIIKNYNYTKIFRKFNKFKIFKPMS